MLDKLYCRTIDNQSRYVQTWSYHVMFVITWSVLSTCWWVTRKWDFHNDAFYHMAQGCLSSYFLKRLIFYINIRLHDHASLWMDHRLRDGSGSARLGSSRELMMEASIIYGSIKCWILSITYILLLSISHDKCITVMLIYHWTTSCSW